MEDWQLEIINTNLSKLIKFTICSTGFLTSLVDCGILVSEDLEQINLATRTRSQQVHEFYTIIMTRENGFDKLVHALQETNQTGAFGILNCGKNIHNRIVALLNELRRFNLERKHARLIEIVKIEDLSIIKGVVEGTATNLDITQVCRKEEKSLLHVAVARGDDDVVEFLLHNAYEKLLSEPRFDDVVPDYIMDIYEIDADAFTQKCRILELLFRKRPQLIESRTTDREQYTPLLVAVSREFVNGKQVEFIEMLLRHNPNLNATDEYGNTPLHLLFWNESVPGNAVEIILLLITHNANPDALNGYGETFLHKAACNASPSLFHEVVVYLVSIHKTNSFTITDSSYGGYTVLHWAVRWMKGEPLSETLQIFKTHPVDFNAINKGGESVMFTAIRGKRSETFLNTLMHFGADWTITNEKQEAALHKAAYYKNLSALKLFISLKADVNAKDKEGNTPLHIALSGIFRNIDHDIVAELVNNGADPTLKNNKQQSPIDLAKQQLKQGKVQQRTVQLLENAIPCRILKT